MEDTMAIVEVNANGAMGYYKYNPLYPRYSTYGVIAKTAKISFRKERESVDTGEFIPGEYRVNPYKVANGVVRANYTVGIDLDQEAIPYAYSAYGRPVYSVRVGNDYVWLQGEWWRIWMLKAAYDEVTPHEADDYEQLSLQKAYGKLKSADLALGESLGEYKETIQMLRSPLSGLKKFLLDDKSRNFRLLRALAKKDKRQVNRLLGRTGLASADTMSSTWLELRYGLRPLVSLVQDVIERVHDKSVEILDPTKIRSARSSLSFGPTQRWVDVKHTYGYAEISARVMVEDTYRSVASVQYLQKEEQSFLDSLGLTPRFLPEVAWELTRLSFVVDWIFSIGPWLATLRVNPGIEVLGNTSGFKHTRKIRPQSVKLCLNGNFPPVEMPQVMIKDCIYNHDYYERKVDVDLSYLPHFTWGRTLDLFKAIDSVSLIWQFMSGFKK
jgi:hypothetical protein